MGDSVHRGHTRFRVLIYSHDSFGLGHLRRCRTIAHAIVRHRPDVAVLILSGSPIIGSFSFCERVDFVRIPGIIKLQNGNYEPHGLDIGLDETLAIRAAILEHTARAFRPDIFLVDKEPLGLRGEVKDTLVMLKAAHCHLVLGLRDVMDEPGQLAWEWERKHAAPALTDLYDSIWVYGLPQICNALEGIDLPSETEAKIRYTGYLRRETTGIARGAGPAVPHAGMPYLLVTPGGGGDGALLVDWVLRAYESDPGIAHPALIVLGPFMHSDRQAEFIERARRLHRVETLIFDANLEDLIAASAAIVAMGGYNTFCEILSFDKPALLVPREAPRLEQYIRAERAAALGLITMLRTDDADDAGKMAAMLRALPARPRPSEIRIEGLLDGLDVICALIDQWLAATPSPRQKVPALS